MAYVELHACSAFSFLRGASFPEQIADTAAELEMPAAALLDRNGVYGSQRFSTAAREKGVRPIVGAELTMENGSVLPVLVKNKRGYANLCALLTEAHLRSEAKGECAVQWGELPQFREGLVALLGPGSAGCQPAVAGSLPATFRGANKKRSSFRQAAETSRLAACATRNISAHAQELIDAFGRTNVYVEIQRHFLRGEERTNQDLRDLAAHQRLPVIATNGVQYATPRGREVLDVFTCIREHTHLDAAGRLLDAKRRAPPEERPRNACVVSRFAGGDHEHGTPRRSAGVLAREHRLRVPRLSGTGRSQHGFLPAHDHVVRRAAALRSGQQQGETAARRRAGADHEARFLPVTSSSSGTS